MAALRATRENEVKHGAERLPCLRGTPIKGERIGDMVFDGVTEAAIFPGDLPNNPEEALDKARGNALASLSLVRFRPPRIKAHEVNGKAAALPHIRLDRALDFLISDYLA